MAMNTFVRSLCIFVLFVPASFLTTAQDKPVFNHVLLHVSDLDRSLHFYTTAFDLKETERFGEITYTRGDSTIKRNVKIVFLKFPWQDFVFELAQLASPPIAEQAGLYQHIGVEVKNIVATAERLVAAGARQLRPITHVRTDSGLEIKQAFFQGPDGEQIELVELIKGEY